MIDYFILDKEKKRLRLYDAYREDGFCKCFENIEKIQMEKNSEKEKQTRVIIIETKDSELPISIEIDKDNNIIGYSNPQLTQVGDRFLQLNNQLSKLNLPQLTQVGNNFLGGNNQLSELNLPQLTQVGDGFLENLSAAVKQLAKIEGEKGIEINLKTEKTSLQQKVFYKDRKIENNVQIETISNDNIEKNENSKSAFIENIKIIEDENTLLLKRYIRGEIKKEDLTEEQKNLYIPYIINKLIILKNLMKLEKTNYYNIKRNWICNIIYKYYNNRNLSL